MSVRRLRELFCIAALALVSATAEAQTPRVVQVVVTVTAEQFTQELTAAQRKSIEDRIAADVAAELARPFPLVEWHAQAGGASPAMTLTGNVIETNRRHPDRPGSGRIVLHWSAHAGSNDIDMSKIRDRPLYELDNIDRPISDAGGRFTSDLDVAALELATLEPNVKWMRENFLGNVMLADLVIPADAQLVLVPLPWIASKMGSDSELSVRYVGGGANAANLIKIRLTGVAPRLTEPQRGNTQTRFSDCIDGSESLNGANGWSQCVAPLGENPPKHVQVFATKYSYDANPDVVGGLVQQEN